MADLQGAVRARYLALNGEHPVTSADDRYLDARFLPLSQAGEAGIAPADLVGHMLAGALPLPAYLRPDGQLMIARNIMSLAAQVGGDLEELPRWFGGQFADPGLAALEWSSYLSGHYFACLREPAPATIQRKDALMAAIGALIAAPRPGNGAWLADLHEQIDGLDALEMPFTAYDRLRFGGPTSRGRMITDLRARFPPRPAAYV
jgi:hypothetical protein